MPLKYIKVALKNKQRLHDVIYQDRKLGSCFLHDSNIFCVEEDNDQAPRL